VEGDIPVINTKAKEVCEAKQAFERLVMSKAQALRLFADNPFKVQLISTKIPEGSYTTAYRCGPLIDLCRGPHVPATGAIKAMEVTKHSSAYWLGKTENDSLQRVYGISFPDAKLMKEYKRMVEEAKKRDHRLLGGHQELFFFHELSPGSCFFMPHGARIFNRLTEHIRSEYRVRGFHEVVTPNMFNLDLWRISGHADHYLENMFTFQVEGADFGLKPMNCPGHCLMFDHRVRSYRELPLRLADFGVLHRNEFSGALTGLTRVRRFQQDDAHIFCRPDQIREEVTAALEFMNSVYGVFGFTFELDLSTRPKKALGSLEVWRRAEAMMQEALEVFGRPWKLNPGDGAFYGPKIDIKVFDALGRRHQCATIQLDFQLPIRFNLRYKARNVAEEAEAEAAAAAAESAAAEGGGGGGGGGGGAEAVAVVSPPPAPGAAGGEKKAEKVDKEAAKAAAKAAAKERGLAYKAAAAAAVAAGGGGGGGGEAAQEEKEEPAAAVAPAAAAAAPPAGSASISQVAAMVERARSGVDELPVGFERPVIIHRAILGSVERFTAVLIEHTGGKWPFWLSPRQVCIVPVALKYLDYAREVERALHGGSFFVDIDATHHTLNKKIRDAQLEQYNFILVVGAEEAGAGTVNIRTRANERLGTMPLADFLALCNKHMREHTQTV
jgi:threonyl-tRNA synthetase